MDFKDLKKMTKKEIFPIKDSKDLNRRHSTSVSSIKRRKQSIITNKLFEEISNNKVNPEIELEEPTIAESVTSDATEGKYMSFLLDSSILSLIL